MALRCLVFSSDEGIAVPICQVLEGLGVEGEHCLEAAAAIERLTSQTYQIVITDWDQQPESVQLLTAARERKPAERPLTLAIVSDDGSVAKALQSGANSILRRPILANQVKDTLTTARDLLRAKESGATAAHAAAAGASAGPVSTLPASMEPGTEKTLRAGEFLQSAPATPGGQFVTESRVPEPSEQFAEPVDPLKDLEPMAASVGKPRPAPPPPPPAGEPRGLEWYLKQKAAAAAAAGPAQAPAPAPPGRPELVGFDQPITYSPTPAPSSSPAAGISAPDTWDDREIEGHKEEKEEQIFSYITSESDESRKAVRSPLPRKKKAILGALVLAGCAIAAAPQAPWHPKVRALWVEGRQSVHAWLNPQVVTTPQAPVSHEDFGQPGDEYKLPATENIPDATTDPSQIQVLPVVDPTAKKPNGDAANPDQTAAASTGPTDQAPAAGAGAQPDQPTPSSPDAAQPAAPAPASSPSSVAPTPVPATPAPVPAPHISVPVAAPPPAPVALSTASVVPPAPARNLQPQYASTPGEVPSSLQSQMASMTPDASGAKPIDSAMPSIEPVDVPEATERSLLTNQPPLGYPANAKGQQGTVVLQVLVGRDGAVQDAKFLQGSLAFARTAIEGVTQWKFKPYTMNGRPVSVQTRITISFKPGS